MKVIKIKNDIDGHRYAYQYTSRDAQKNSYKYYSLADLYRKTRMMFDRITEKKTR